MQSKSKLSKRDKLRAKLKPYTLSQQNKYYLALVAYYSSARPTSLSKYPNELT